ncbi:MAG: hypothetical protein GX891_03185, partial [Clostridiales bacterium]|nr:hypothetical protein [Clostridiales bacterium]
IIFVTLLTILTAAIAITAYILLRRNYSRRDALKDFAPSGESKAKKFISHPATIAGIISIAAIAIRFALLFTLFGNGAETARLIVLARKVAELHPTGIMSYLAEYSSSQVIYTPGILYILYAIGGIGYYVPDAGLSQLLRLPALLCDIGTVLIIYFYGRKYVGNKISTIFASLYAILPVAFVMSGLRGSFESILAFLLVFGFILLIEKKYIPMYAVMVLAVLLDIRALAVVPLAVCYLVYMYYKADKTLKTFGKIRATIIFGFVASLVCFYLLSLPFMINDVRAGSFFKILVYYKDIMATNNIFVSNAFNLYGMVAMNNKIVTKTVSILNLIFLLILMIYVISLYVKNRNRLELILLASFTLAVIAVFTLKISETYLFLSLALMLIYTMISGEKRMYIVFSGYSILSFLNIGQLLSQSGLIIANSKHAIVSFETTGVFYILFSVVAVLLTLYYGYVTYSICNNDKLIDIKPMPENLIQTIKNSFNKLKKRIKKVG